MSLSKRVKIVLGVLASIVIAGCLVLGYAYKPHQTIEQREVKFVGTVDDFNAKVASDFLSWNDVVVKLTGEVSTIDTQGFTLNNTTFCQFSEPFKFPKLKKGQTITIKARVIGYDDLLEELKLDHIKIID